VLSVALALALLGVAAPGSVAFSLLSLGLAGVAALGAFALAAVVRVRSLGAFGVRGTTRRWLLWGLGGGVLAWLVNRGIVVGYVLITGDTTNPQAALMPGVTGSALALAGTLLLGAVLVPIGEELLFRGVVTTALGRYGAWVAVLFSALVSPWPTASRSCCPPPSSSASSTPCCCAAPGPSGPVSSPTG
jgi:membrane protease YdiL (CAAX protease family)